MKESIYDRIDLGPIFSNTQPEVIRWIVALAMAANDLSWLAHKVGDTQVDYEKFCYFRLAFAHLREIAKVVGESLQNKIISTYISGLNYEAQETYKKIEKDLGDYNEKSFVKNVLKVPRDEIFHYPDIKGKLWDTLSDDARRLNKVLIDFDKNNKTIMGTRYRFTDILISQRINKKLSKDLVSQSSAIAANLISFVDYIFEYLTQRKN